MALGHSDKAHERDEIAAIQHQSLLERLAIARAQISDLERQERSLRSELDTFRDQLSSALSATQRDISGQMLFAPARIQALISTLTIVQRRDLWLTVTADLPLSQRWSKLYPHDGSPDRLRILVCGSGGYGDMLYLSMIVRGLFARFDAPEIFVLHEHPGVVSVFGTNPYVSAADALSASRMSDILNACATLDMFDLVADVRYAVSYFAPPLSRAPSAFVLEASARSVEWQKFCRDDWPFLNNIFAHEIVDRGFNQYTFAEFTANLHFDGQYFGAIFPAESLSAALKSTLAGPYVTVHHGSDRNMASSNGLQTKNLPSATWGGIVERLTEANFTVVQLGEKHEELVPGRVVDLRGALSLSEAALVLKQAQVHIDSEGGLVHLARAAGTKSVVAFGPTTPEFFGYPGNVNLEPPDCGDCWWTASTWATACPRGFVQPQCMSSHHAASIANAAISAGSRQKIVEIASMRARRDSQPAFTGMKERAGATVRGFVLASSAAWLEFPRLNALRTVRSYALPPLFETVSQQAGIQATRPALLRHIDEATDSVDFAVVEVPTMAAADDVAELIGEIARTVRSGGTASLSFPGDSQLTLADLAASIQGLPGVRAALTVKLADDSASLGGSDLELSISERALAIPSASGRAMRRIFRKQTA